MGDLMPPSLLFGDPTAASAPADPAVQRRDLNVDQIVADLTTGDDEDLVSLYAAGPADRATVEHRHAVLTDLAQPANQAVLRTFVARMSRLRDQLRLLHSPYTRHQTPAWCLEAAETYCGSVLELVAGLRAAPVGSAGLIGYRDYLVDYTESAEFGRLSAAAAELRQLLSGVEYCVQLDGNRVTVSGYDGQPDYTAELAATFARFDPGDRPPLVTTETARVAINGVETEILDRVADLHPAAFGQLEQFYAGQSEQFPAAAVVELDRQVRFFLRYLDYLAPMRDAGLPFCLPALVDSAATLAVTSSFDLALARRQVLAGNTVVCNDVQLAGAERVIVVTGPNQGGKTTFARAVGQVFLLAGLGLPVPGRSATLRLPDRIFTHFEQAEDLRRAGGRLEDELVRLADTLRDATSDSVLVLNEPFSSTTTEDAALLAQRVLDRVVGSGALCICVSFIPDLGAGSPTTVTMVSELVPDRPADRTYRIVRATPDPRAYATALAARHGLTYSQLTERLAR
ncbi:MAG: DNA mismatch repair protein MutS [Actinomycetota bacterium]|nr:MAG: DNA mismatch repair protein MutS [Actinomycetota bacterium]